MSSSTRVLVLNAGSSSVKYRLLDGDDQVAAGTVERIGQHGAPPDHAAAFATVFDAVDTDDLLAVGHRVVHGGSRFTDPTLVDDDVLAALAELEPLAPLHNPAGVAGIEAAREHVAGVPQVAVFDTAFHATMPPRASRYSLPRDLADEHGIRRYGFHGISHGYVSRRAAEHLGRPLAETALVTLHLGNGASAAAVLGGRSIDTSMGLTPLSGLVMGTRGGDVDPSVVFHLHREAGMGVEDVEDLLNRRSGMLGLTGSTDLRDVHARAESGTDTDAEEALDLYAYRVRSYLGAYAFALGRVDAVVFTAGVGEHDADVRRRVCAGLEGFGIELSTERNTADADGVRTISADDGRVAVLVVPTDEEREIARQTRELLTTADRPPARPS